MNQINFNQDFVIFLKMGITNGQTYTNYILSTLQINNIYLCDGKVLYNR